MKEYTTIEGEAVAEIVIERSRFIAAAKNVQSTEEAMAFVESKRKRHYDATHNCYAFIVGDKSKFSDDGEPQGTAGMPIFECLRQNGLDHVCVVVTRYFGGIKLGAGGLVRAYSGSSSEVLSKAKRVHMTDCTRAEVTVEYSLLKPLRNALQSLVKEEAVIFEDKVRLVLLFPTVSSTTITHIVSEITLGKGIFEVKEQLLAQFEAK